MTQLNTLPPKDPSDRKDYGIEWKFRDGDEIDSSAWTVQSGLTKIADPITSVMDPFTSNFAIVWVEGGTAGTNYLAVNTIITIKGRILTKTITIRVKDL